MDTTTKNHTMIRLSIVFLIVTIVGGVRSEESSLARKNEYPLGELGEVVKLGEEIVERTSVLSEHLPEDNWLGEYNGQR